MSAYSKGELGVGANLGVDKGEGKKKTEEVRSGEVVAHRARMSLAIVRSNSLLLRGPHEKEVQFWQQPDLTDGAVMPLLAPWRG